MNHKSFLFERTDVKNFVALNQTYLPYLTAKEISEFLFFSVDDTTQISDK
jgi:hypothetical protein